MSIKEVDNLLTLLAEKKRKMEQEEAERNMQILLDFLHCLRKQKVDELNEVGFVLDSGVASGLPINSYSCCASNLLFLIQRSSPVVVVGAN